MGQKLFTYDSNFQSDSAKLTISKLTKMLGPDGIACDDDRYLQATENESEIKLLGGTIFTVSNNIFESDEVTFQLPWIEVLDPTGALTEEQATSLAEEAGISLTTWTDKFSVTPLYVLVHNENVSSNVLSFPSDAFNAIGKDYYIYICDPTNGNQTIDQDEVYLITTNASAPSGYTTSNSKCIGGFHFGLVRRTDEYHRPINSAGTALGAGWESNVYIGVVPNSVWTVYHRPKCNPKSMVYIGANLWANIYICTWTSSDKFKAPAEFGKAISYPRWWTYGVYSLSNEQKRLPTFAEYCVAALGSPSGRDNNIYAWSYSENTSYSKTGYVLMAVSSYNVCDLVGNSWKRVSDIFSSETVATIDRVGATVPPYNLIVSSYLDVAPLFNTSPTSLFGQILEYHTANSSTNAGIGIKSMAVGGSYNSGTHAGRRAVCTEYTPFETQTHMGAVWGVCEGKEVNQ